MRERELKRESERDIGRRRESVSMEGYVICFLHMNPYKNYHRGVEVGIYAWWVSACGVIPLC